MAGNPYDLYLPKLYEGDPNPDTLHLAIGRTLTAWEQMESALATLFSLVTTGGSGWSSRPAINAYGSVTTARGRKEMVQKAVDGLFGEAHLFGPEHSATAVKLREEIRRLLNLFTQYSTRRNEIAHGVVARSQIVIPEGLDLEPDMTFYVFPAPYNTTKTYLPPTDIYIVRKPGKTDQETLADQIKLMMHIGTGKYKFSSSLIYHYKSGIDGLREELTRLTSEIAALFKALSALQDAQAASSNPVG